MILLELEIEDYKQFSGKHLFTPTQNGVVGIIGANGSGKTTLFEAIEWCLYQPREIRNDEIPPRGTQNRRPRVRIRFTNPHTGQTHEIERTLRKSGASAEIRRIDETGATIVATGSSTVSNYTATRLIGLEHRAFVATFFTRQKELSFFGALKPTERRREVGRLLGLETIRNAQEVIAAERSAKRATAQGLLAQYNQESGERDFDAEQAGHQQRLTEIDQQTTETAAALITAEEVFRHASAIRAQLVEEREHTLRLRAELGTHQGAIAAADKAIGSAQEEIARLATLDAERPALLEMAGQLEACEQRVTSLEADRERFQRRQTLLDLQTRAQTDIDALTAQATSMIAQTRTERPGLLRETNPLDEIEVFLAKSATVSADQSQLQLERLQRLCDEQATVAKLERDQRRFLEVITGLEEDRARLLAAGDPVDDEATAIERRDEAIRAVASYAASIDSHKRTLADYALFAKRDHVHIAGSICPTCGREIAADDAESIRALAERRSREIEQEIARVRGEIAHHEKQIEAIEHEISRIRTRGIDLTALASRIANGRTTVAETESALAEARQIVIARMTEMGRSDPVTEHEIADQRERVQAERTIEQCRSTLRQIRETLTGHQTRLAELASEIAAIGDVAFDPADLVRARATLEEARAARTRLAWIDQQLTRTTEFNASIETATAQRSAAQSEVARLEAEVAAHPIDEYALDKADLEVEQARQREQQIRAQVESHRRSRMLVEQALLQIQKDRERIQGIADRAEIARVAADDLDRMYKEFNLFEQYVARRVRPQLEDMTSELVRVITEGAYESIELDDDYGVTVWDGELGPYSIEHFSGGERDVIALSARLALSRLIGSQAANPPSFLVLDEVFGSLDRERRTNVLSLLSSLAGSAESFQQLFVISHVDDVQLSPAFNEIWRVAELADGSSRLENLNLSQGGEDL